MVKKSKWYINGETDCTFEKNVQNAQSVNCLETDQYMDNICNICNIIYLVYMHIYFTY